jgi:hypothetical protein
MHSHTLFRFAGDMLIEFPFVEFCQRPEHANLDRARIVHGNIQSAETYNRLSD